MPHLFLWNSTKYSAHLVKELGEDNIVVSAEEFAENIKDLGRFNSLIVLCELNWCDNGLPAKMQEMRGIELVKKLRRVHDLVIPVLFVSFRSLEDILNPEREILTAVGHEFHQLPAIPQDFITFIEGKFFEDGMSKKLSPMELTDIKSFYCSKEGILSHELHYLNRYLNFEITDVNHNEVYEDLTGAIKRIHELFLLDPRPAIFAFQAAFPSLIKSTISKAVNHIIRIGDSLSNEYGTRSESLNGTTSTALFPWKVLFLDDEIDENHELVRSMNKKGIQVISVNSAREAEEELRKDSIGSKNIMVIIADYRLYEKEGVIRKHQKKQGYTFLKDVAASDHLVRLVAFSGLQRKFLLNSFKHYNLRTEVKSKADYLLDNHTHDLFCEEIIELAEENWQAVESMPSGCIPFANSLQKTYKDQRMNPAYNRMESDISLTAKMHVSLIQEQVKSGEEINIGPFPIIKSSLRKTVNSNEAYFSRYQHYMVARRIALWIYAANKRGKGMGIDSKDVSRRIAEILTNTKYGSGTSGSRQIISTCLCLRLDDFPFNITVEERYWLHYEMEIPIIRDIYVILPFFQKCSAYLKEYIVKADPVRKSITDQKFKVRFVYKGSKENKNNGTEIKFRQDFSPVIKTPGDLKECYWLLKDLVKDDPHLGEELDKTVTYIREALKQALQLSRSPYIYSLLQYFNTIVSRYTASKNRESRITTDDNEMMFDLLKSGKELDEKKSPHLLHLFTSAFMAWHDLLAEGITMNETVKKKFFERLAFYESQINTDSRIVLGDRFKNV
jgi:hypothetical protein